MPMKQSQRGASGTPRSGPWKYPIDIGEEYKTKITFQAIEVIPPKITVFGSSETVSEGRSGPPGASGQIPATNQSIGFSNTVVNELAGEKVELFVPIAFQVNDGFDYSTPSLGLLGGALLNAGNSGTSLFKAGMQSIGEGLGSIFDLAKSGEVGRIAAVRAAQNLGDTVGSAASVLTRASLNPNIRTQFNAASVREFNFTFKMIPRSQEESLNIKAIIRFFRFHSYPEKIDGAGANIAFNYPNLFRIRLLTGSGDRRFKNVGTPIKLCYLKTVAAAYNATSPVLHEDGAPTEVDLTLTFTEYKPLSRSDVVGEELRSFYDYENQSSFPPDKYGGL